MRQIKHILVLIVALTATLPLMYWIPNINAISIMSMLVWLLLNFFDRPKMLLKSNVIYYLLSTFYLFYIIFVPYISGNSAIANRYLDLYTLFFFYIVYKENVERSNNKSNYKILIIIFSLSALTYFRTLIELLSNPYIIRTIKNAGIYSLNTLRQGIGGYSFLYFIIFIGIISFGFFMALKSIKRVHNKRGLNLLLLSVVFATVTMAVLSNYLTAIFLLSIGMAIILIFGLFKFRINWLVITSLFLLPILLYFWKKITSSIITMLISIIGEGYTSNRLEVFNNYLLYGSDLESVTHDRDLTREISIQAILDNPFLGLITSKLQTLDGSLTGFGQHSYILDTFALFGIFVGILNLYLLFYPFLERIRKGNNITKLLSYVLLILTLVFFYINNAVGSIGFAVYFIFPIICDYLEKYTMNVSDEKVK